MKGPKILFADIETSFMKIEMPSFSTIMHNKYISHKHIKKDWYIISIAWKFEGQKRIKSVSVLDDAKRFKNDPTDDTHVLEVFRKVLEQADMVVGHNFKKFDMKKINARFISRGIAPIANTVVYDTLTEIKKIASFSSNRLDFLAPALGYKGKIDSTGLWDDIYNENGNNPKAIKEMVKYNKNDIDILEYVYNYVKPYASPVKIYKKENCSKCGSNDVHKYGTKMFSGGKRQVYRCNSCGGITKGELV